MGRWSSNPRYVRTEARLGALLMVFCLAGCTRQTVPKVDRTPFTVAVLPDTQIYSKSHPALFMAQTEWIKANRDKENIVFVSQAGDIVNDHTKLMYQWPVASKAMGVLDGVVPWGVAIGNHDYDSGGIRDGVATEWIRNFGPDRFKGLAWYGGASSNQLNSYQFFSGGGVDFIIFHLEMSIADEEIAWVKDVLARYPNRAAILTMHIYLKGRDGIGRNPKRELRPHGNSGENIWQKLVRPSPQIFMVICGHEGRSDEYHQFSTNDAGQQVFEMLADYQKRERGGNGYLRLLRFVPAAREIQVRTYSPVLNQFETDANSEFVVPWVIPKAVQPAGPVAEGATSPRPRADGARPAARARLRTSRAAVKAVSLGAADPDRREAMFRVVGMDGFAENSGRALFLRLNV